MLQIGIFVNDVRVVERNHEIRWHGVREPDHFFEISQLARYAWHADGRIHAHAGKADVEQGAWSVHA